MILQSRHFGEIDIDPAEIISFSEGLPGFPDDKQFILLEKPEEFGAEDDKSPFLWLQSVSNGDNAFILLDALLVLPDYKPMLNTTDFSELGEYTEKTRDDFLVYNIVVLPEDIRQMSVNLVAPVLINQATKKGKQVISTNNEYSVRYLLFNEVNE